ncbi:probable ribonuclease ZC3H12C isoform X2 [Planococcus citri]|uniref:probable ribonuclease ZC3H12C isoform X2 n=1 Tax=Planococcus citri TaxID=170843 RepID=UPI0031F98BC8
MTRCMNLNYINSLCDEFESEKKSKFGGPGTSYSSSATGEDSSYDSDYDGSEEQTHGHDDVSRTVSDTLGQEFSEYVTSPQPAGDSVYQSKVEFALKLGYTERLVQAALQKLGPNPEQNELLAELIKLGAHQQSSKLKNDGDSFDSVEDFAVIDQQCADGNKLRPIVIDGSNVAMSHGNKEVFSCRGIKICVDWFRSRGHNEITVFVPKWRKEAPRADNLVIDQEILNELERERLLVFTPSREIRGKRMVCYDDRYILKLAADNDGIVVSNDNYRDLIQECPEFRKVIEERILMYSFVNDRFMPPDDPLGRSGPTLDNFLKMPTFRKGETCPYGKKCTYGNKCKYNHPERGLGPQKSITDRLLENHQKQLLARNMDPNSAKKLKGKSLSLPLQSSMSDDPQPHLGQIPSARKQPLIRTKSTTFNCKIDPDTKNIPKLDTPSGPESCCLPRSCPVSTSATHVPIGAHAQQSYNYRMMYPMGGPVPPQINQPEVGVGQSYMSANRSPVETDSSVNLHRKLQRELSINPTCDPRIYQLRRHLTSPESQHLPVSRHYSYQDANYLSAHSNVTRISSAPPANPPYTVANECTHGSSSDPQLNLHVPGLNAALWPAPAQQHNYSGPPMTSNIEETRRKLHYHLASIFPEEQVDAAMRYYPNETNPQKICAAILSMFSSKP